MASVIRATLRRQHHLRFLAVRLSGPIERKLAALRFASGRIEVAVRRSTEPSCIASCGLETPVSCFGVVAAMKSQRTVPEAVWKRSREG
jgi:hypothetical protein